MENHDDFNTDHYNNYHFLGMMILAKICTVNHDDSTKRLLIVMMITITYNNIGILLLMMMMAMMTMTR